MKKLKVIILILVLIGGMLLMTGCLKMTENIESTSQKEQITECDHDWVTVSEYSFWANSYKIVSKCSKCGKVVD